MQANEQRKQSKWPLLGAVAGAIAASVCCLGPLIFVVLGVTGAWMGSLRVLDPYRPFFMIASAVLLGISFYRAYGRRKPTCDSETACSEARISKLSRVALWCTTILVVALFAFPYILPALYSGDTDASSSLESDGDVIVVTSSPSVAQAPLEGPGVLEGVAATNASDETNVMVAEMSTAVLRVENLTCSSCVSHAISRLKALTGVASAEVTRRPSRAVVEYDPATISVDELAAALTSIGYPAQPVTGEE